MQIKTASGKFLLVIFLFAGFVAACGYKEHRDGRVIERGPFRCVYREGIKEIDGKEHAEGLGATIFVNGKEYSPSDYPHFGNNIISCRLSPNPDVVLMGIRNGTFEHHGYYILRMENGEPMLTKITDYKGDTGCWTSDGRWLLFIDYFVNAETNEKKPIKTLPVHADCTYSLTAISPDMKTIVQRDYVTEQDKEKDIITLKVTDTETGETKEEKFKLSEYKWLTEPDYNINESFEGAEYLPISNQFKWEKDKKGKDVFIYPKPLVNKNMFR